MQGYREPFTASPQRWAPLACMPRGLQPHAPARRSPRTPVLVSPRTPIRRPAPSGGPTWLSRHDFCFVTPWPCSWHPILFFGAQSTWCCRCRSRSSCEFRAPIHRPPLPMSRGRRPPAPFSLQQTMSDRSTPSRDSPSRAADTGRGGALHRGPFPMFLMDIAQSDDAIGSYRIWTC